MSGSIHIVATGARTPLGLTAAASAAAVRAGLSALIEHPFMIDQAGEPMPAALDHELDPALMGARRLLALLEPALREVCEPLRDGPQLRLPIYLALPELRPGFTEKDAEAIRAGCAAIDGLPVAVSDVRVSAEGHAAGLAALDTASRQIQEGRLEACLIGGAESYFQPDTMEWLDENLQLVGRVSRSGFVPGEGAGFCLLMGERMRRGRRMKSLAHLLGCAVGREKKLIKTNDMCFGEGLTATVQAAASRLRLSAETINDVICDINGERYRGEEWGFVCLRISQLFDDPTRYRPLTSAWGDMGAASGPLFVMLACEAAARGYNTGPRILLWTGSERGLRSAAVLGLERANAS